MNRYPLLFKLILLFIFFLPLKSLEIPGAVTGFSINPARLFTVLSVITVFFYYCRNRSVTTIFLASDKNHNPFLVLLVAYILLSTLQYYITLVFNETLLFGSRDFLFRSWKGRPIGQLISFLTYGVIPFFIVKHFAENDKQIATIEKVLGFAILFLIYYGLFQQISFYLGLPVTGYDFYYRVVPVYQVNSVNILRFYSFGGEPRDFGGFILGAMFFYLYCNYDKKSLFVYLNLMLMILAALLTMSTSSYIGFVICAAALFVDTIFLKRKNLLKVAFITALCLVIFFLALHSFTDIVYLFSERTFKYAKVFTESIKTTGSIHFWVTAQSQDLAVVYYFINFDKIDLYQLFFGSGFGNFLTPVADILKEYFNYNPAHDPIFTDTRSFGVKIFVELGIFGAILYILALLYPLKLNKVLIRFYSRTDRVEYFKLIILRYSYIVFCVSNLIQISYYYFIIMAIMVGKYNSFAQSKENNIIYRHNVDHFALKPQAV